MKIMAGNSNLPLARAIAGYLDGIRFRNGVVRWSYLESLGLKSEP